MKGKIIYTTVVEKEIEVPDEIINICETPWEHRTEKQDEILDDYTNNIWEDIEHDNRIGIYYMKDGKTFYVAEY